MRTEIRCTAFSKISENEHRRKAVTRKERGREAERQRGREAESGGVPCNSPAGEGET